MIAPRLLPLWIKIVLRSRIKIQLAKNSTCSRAILDLLHSIFLNVANCTRCARAILQHLKKVSCNKSRIALERVLFYVLTSTFSRCFMIIIKLRKRNAAQHFVGIFTESCNK